MSVLIIAEAGVNHNGSLEIAKDMCRVAENAGADIVKFQSFDPDVLATSAAPKAEYQSKRDPGEETQQDMLRRLALSPSEQMELLDHCREIGIRFCSSPFDSRSAEFLRSAAIGLWKIPSGEITNLPLLRQIGSYGEPVILSTGMSTLNDVHGAVDLLVQSGTGLENITLLQCNTDYPTRMEDANIRGMAALSREFGTAVGFSDHTPGIEVPIAAVALGAAVIEKHFTLDRSAPGPDHYASLDPDELRDMVRAIRNIEKALGSDQKVPTASELRNAPVARKSIVAAKDIAVGAIMDEENLCTKRPGTGMSPMVWDSLIGKPASKAYAKDDLIDE